MIRLFLIAFFGASFPAQADFLKSVSCTLETQPPLKQSTSLVLSVDDDSWVGVNESDRIEYGGDGYYFTGSFGDIEQQPGYQGINIQVYREYFIQSLKTTGTEEIGGVICILDEDRLKLTTFCIFTVEDEETGAKFNGYCKAHEKGLQRALDSRQ